METDPRSLARRLEALEPSGDEALELARVALGLTGRMPYRLEAAVGAVVTEWAKAVVAHADRGAKLRDQDEHLAEARLWILEQLAEFRPAAEGGTCAVFLRARFAWFRSKARRGVSTGVRSHGRFAVTGAVGRARDEFEKAEHRKPTSSELKDRVTLLLTEQTRRKVLDRDPTLTGDELDKAVRARMVKDGLHAALGEYTLVLVDAQRPLSLRLFESREDDPRPNWGAALPVVEPDEDEPDAEEAYERLLAVALGDAQWARAALSARGGDHDSGADSVEGSTLRDLAGDDHSVGELKRTLVEARSRINAPHAQWAHLAPSVTVVDSIDDDLSDGPSPWEGPFDDVTFEVEPRG